MLTRLEVLGLRSLRYLDLRLAPFQVLVGPSGAGKSTLLDALLFLRDLVRHGLKTAVLGDEAAGVPPRAVVPSSLCFEEERLELAIELSLPEQLSFVRPKSGHQRARYEVSLALDPMAISTETLWLAPPRPDQASLSQWRTSRRTFPESLSPPDTICYAPRTAATSSWSRVLYRKEDQGTFLTSKKRIRRKLKPQESALGQLPEEMRGAVAWWLRQQLLDGVERFRLRPEALRRDAAPGSSPRLGPDGANLPRLIAWFKAHYPQRYRRWLEYIQGSLPNIVSIDTATRASNLSCYLVLEERGGRRLSSEAISSGALLFIALTLLSYLPDAERVYLIEDPEAGLSPHMIEAVYQSLSSTQNAQVLIESHSLVGLSQVRPGELRCFARDLTGATDVAGGDELPGVDEEEDRSAVEALFAAGLLG